MHRGHKIKTVLPGSIADQLEIQPGDFLLSINQQIPVDIFDYHFLANDSNLLLLIQKRDGEEWEIEVEKEEEEDLGLLFEKGLMDDYRSCQNKCIFCFIDQMPPGMRETLYFKDDDARLSFLQGNYITLTNLKDADMERIIKYRLSPVNVSVHTTNPELRCKMLHNRFAGEALKKIKVLYDSQITMNSQVVLCKGINDGPELSRTIIELSGFYPYMKSLSVVPAGLTKYRDGLHPLGKFTREEAKEVLLQIEEFQKQFYRQYKTRFVFASDEWYFKAEEPFPQGPCYEGYGQIENGVGMVRSLLDEFKKALLKEPGDREKRSFSMATGALFAPILSKLAHNLKKKFPASQGRVYEIQNDFFGKDITVAGLITGQDLIRQLKDKPLGDYLLLPQVMLRSGQDVFLDDVTLEDLKNALQIEVRIVQSDGTSLLHAMTAKTYW